MTNENAVNVDICLQTHKFIAVIQETLLSFRVITREQAPLLLHVLLGDYVESSDAGNLLFLSGTIPVTNRKIAI
jgi:hypothetical protein